MATIGKLGKKVPRVVVDAEVESSPDTLEVVVNYEPPTAEQLQASLARVRDWQNEIRAEVLQAPAEVVNVLVAQLKAARAWIEKNAPHGRAWRTCICESCLEIRVLMGSHCACDPPKVVIPETKASSCEACGLPLHPA